MLEIKNINKNYLKYKNNIEILKDISYVFHSKKVYTIIGKSGVGKTTLIKILGLILNYDSGEILLNNKSVEKLTEDEKAEIRNKHIGFIFQNFYLNPLMKAYENIMVPMYLDNTLTNKERKEKACQLLKKVDLINREEHYPKELSGGEQQESQLQEL